MEYVYQKERASFVVNKKSKKNSWKVERIFKV